MIARQLTDGWIHAFIGLYSTRRMHNHFDCVALNVNIIADPKPENGHLS
jgi:hypothetical protein